jgi:hypothetical protein
MGAYGLANSLFDVYVLMVVGVIAYFLAKLRVPPVTIALGLVLGRLIEQTYQQSSIVAGAHKEAMFTFFLSRPLNIVLMLVCALVVFSGLRQILRERRGDGGLATLEAGESTAVPAGRGISMRFGNVLVGLISLLLAGAGFLEVPRLSERGGQFPILVASMFLVFGILLLIQSARPGRRMDRSFPFEELPWRNVGIVVAALVAMTLGLTRIGFYESAFLFSGFTCWLMLGASQDAAGAPLKRLTTALAFATGLMIVVYLAFGLVIQLPTPRGLFL